MNRPAYIDKLISYKDKDIIKVITGLRRSGKSTLLELFRDDLIATGISLEQTQLYNYELPENFLKIICLKLLKTKNPRWSNISTTSLQSNILPTYQKSLRRKVCGCWQQYFQVNKLRKQLS